MILKIHKKQLHNITAHARRSYPHECCGFLIGKQCAGAAEVVRIVAAENRRVDAPHRRFSIAPADYFAVEAQADREGLAIVGFYHSHPDHPAVPSAYDLEHAWPHMHYLIVAVHQGEPTETRNYLLSADRRKFDEIEITPSN